MNKKRISSNRITCLAPNEIFVFGSNLQGAHGGGAARMAYEHFGAVWGKGVGLFGQSYAIPTMQGGVETIKPYVDDFLRFAIEHRELDFLVTEIGCGIAGFTPQDIAPLFFKAIDYDIRNVYLPESFYGVFELPKGYVDLGLPSGTLWKAKNESDDYITYKKAVHLFGSQLPTKGQWEELINYCGWVWNGSGYTVTGSNDKSIILPAMGYGEGDYGGVVVNGKGRYGYYWSSSLYTSDDAWHLLFDTDKVHMGLSALWEGDGLSVRLIRV